MARLFSNNDLYNKDNYFHYQFYYKMKAAIFIINHYYKTNSLYYNNKKVIYINIDIQIVSKYS